MGGMWGGVSLPIGSRIWGGINFLNFQVKNARFHAFLLRKKLPGARNRHQAA